MEKLKRGQKSIDWKENCEKFYEYYHKRNPDWAIEQCKEAAKKFNKSINGNYKINIRERKSPFKEDATIYNKKERYVHRFIY